MTVATRLTIRYALGEIDMKLGKFQSRAMRGFLLVVVCAGVVEAGDKAPRSSFSELLPQAERDLSTDVGQAYHSSLAKALALQHGGVVTSCMRTFGRDGEEPFVAIVVVAADGKITEVVPDSMTNLSKCIQGRLVKLKLPKPPSAPFHDLMRFSFKQE